MEEETKREIEALWGNLTASVKKNADISSEIDKFFLIVMAVVIFFMQCGFAFLEAGSVRYYYVNLFRIQFSAKLKTILIKISIFSIEISLKL